MQDLEKINDCLGDQWIYTPNNKSWALLYSAVHRVFKILVLSPHLSGFDIYLHCGDEEFATIFFKEIAFLLEHRNTTSGKLDVHVHGKYNEHRLNFISQCGKYSCMYK